MSSFLVAPIRLELLTVRKPMRVVEASFDPSRLPRAEPDKDVNSDMAYLGAEVSSPPFQNRNDVLLAGIHLHWQMPTELTRSQPDPTGQSVHGRHPVLPNRWLITRTRFGTKARWVVESDFLHPVDIESIKNATAYPIVGENKNSASDPDYRFLGRVLPLDEWLLSGNKGEYLEGGLTVMGYGNPTFAAFAANCRGVYTFHDEEHTDLDGTEYSVVGFYNKRADVPVLVNVPATIPAQAGELNEPSPKSRPRLLCVGKSGPLAPAVSWRAARRARRRFGSRKSVQRKRSRAQRKGLSAPEPNHTIAVGSSTTEALSALLAQAFLDDEKTTALTSVLRSKAAVENQLEAILLSSGLENRLQDHHQKFLEARHAKGFTAYHGGTRWVIKADSLSPLSQPSANDVGSLPEDIPIPPHTILPLHELNALQKLLDGLKEERKTIVDRISSDWYKYMICAYPAAASRDAYPEPDEVAYIIESTSEKSLVAIDLKMSDVTIGRDSKIDEIRVILENLANGNPAGAPLRLKHIPGSRYWVPNEPAVAFVAPTDVSGYLPSASARVHKNGADKWSEIELSSVPGTSLWDMLDQQIVSTVTPDADSEIREQDDDPARPIFVEWATQLRVPATGFARNKESFRSDYISARFSPAAAAPDLKRRSEALADDMPLEADEQFAYVGRSQIAVNAAQVLHEQLRTFLTKQLGDGPELQETDDDDPVVRRLMAAGTWDQPITQVAMWAWEYLKRTKILCFPLSGFNDALLMRRQTARLPIAEPIGFREYQAFSNRLRTITGDLPTLAPTPLAHFSPIRQGELQPDRLRIIDSFGRFFDVPVTKEGTIGSEPLGGKPIAFPPRFVQPLRAEFHWLSAGHDAVAAHSHPDTSPVCGWFLPNRLDKSIAVYDSDGDSIGALDLNGIWRAAPGRDHPELSAEIDNIHLRRVVLHILDQARDGEYLAAFEQCVNSALDAIDPDSFAAHPAVSLLIGRPIAVVRASVKFELMGEAAEDHSWEMLARVVSTPAIARSRRYEDVQIPFRIGEHHILNDGVVGYWIENEAGGFEENLFHSPQTELPPISKRIVTPHDSSLGSNTPESQSMVLKAAPSSEPVILTLLMDPRGAAHLTSGVLPVKEIQLAENHFATALKNISVTFLATPLLMLNDRTEIPLPGEPHYAWSFLDRPKRSWRETPSTEIKPPELSAAFRGDMELREGWLKLVPKDDSDDETDVSVPTPPASLS